MCAGAIVGRRIDRLRPAELVHKRSSAEGPASLDGRQNDVRVGEITRPIREERKTGGFDLHIAAGDSFVRAPSRGQRAPIESVVFACQRAQRAERNFPYR